MSSFIHSAKHFNTTIHNLEKVVIKENFFYQAQLTKRFGNTLKNPNFIKEQFDVIINLSVLSVIYQYNDSDVTEKETFLIDMTIKDCKSKTDIIEVSPLGLLKLLESIDYQIEIDDWKLTPKESDAYFFLKEIIINLAIYNCHINPDYEDLNWSL